MLGGAVAKVLEHAGGRSLRQKSEPHETARLSIGARSRPARARGSRTRWVARRRAETMTDLLYPLDLVKRFETRWAMRHPNRSNSTTVPYVSDDGAKRIKIRSAGLKKEEDPHGSQNNLSRRGSCFPAMADSAHCEHARFLAPAPHANVGPVVEVDSPNSKSRCGSTMGYDPNNPMVRGFQMPKCNTRSRLGVSNAPASELL